MVSIRAATNVLFVWIFIRILVFRFDLFAFGICLYVTYVMIILFVAFLVQADLYYDFYTINIMI